MRPITNSQLRMNKLTIMALLEFSKAGMFSFHSMFRGRTNVKKRLVFWDIRKSDIHSTRFKEAPGELTADEKLS